jgi:hypothetical protein
VLEHLLPSAPAPSIIGLATESMRKLMSDKEKNWPLPLPADDSDRVQTPLQTPKA